MREIIIIALIFSLATIGSTIEESKYVYLLIPIVGIFAFPFILFVFGVLIPNIIEKRKESE